MRCDVYPLPKGGRTGCMVDVQADFVSNLPTRIVIPLFTDIGLAVVFGDLNPRFVILDHPVFLMTQELASIPKSQLQRPVASLAEHREQITRALDLLLTGF